MSAKYASRDITLDVARGIGILLVVYGHALEILIKDRPDHVLTPSAFAQWQVIYAFHMPLFFLISGAVNRNLGNKSLRQVAESSLSLIFLAFMVHIAGSVVLFFDRVMPWTDLQVLKETFTPLIKGAGFSTVVLWFLYAIGVVQFLFYLTLRAADLKRPRHRIAVRAAVALLCGISIAGLLFPTVPSYLQFKAWFLGLVYFGIGYFLGRSGRLALPAILSLPLFALVVVLAPLNQGCTFNFTSSCTDPSIPGHFAVSVITGAVGNWLLFVITALVGCAATLAISRLKILAPLAYFGRCTLELLILNGFVLVFVDPEISLTPISEMGLDVGGYDIVAALFAAQLALAAIFRRQIAALRILSNRLAGRAIGLLVSLLGRTATAPAASR
jgi:fucose 4-O-acetylase-like acetyltransferase